MEHGKHRFYMITFMKKKNLKIFCISIQRTGTTSVGKFYRDHGLKWAGWPADAKNGWSAMWADGDLESIFSSKDFNAANAYEDSPWWAPGFYRILYHRFPSARFILFERDPDTWFRSMQTHSSGDIIGSASLHSKVYRRELEYWDLVDRGVIDRAREDLIKAPKTMKLEGMDEHYKSLYKLHNREVKDFFQRHNPDALFVAKLDDVDKWRRLGLFLGINVGVDYVAHSNSSARDKGVI